MAASIAFIYPSYAPISGGASVHGWNLARELTKLGYRLHTFNREPDGFSIHHKLRPWNLLTALRQADLVYCRISLQGRSRHLPRLAKRMGKALIVELNGPADELAITKSFDAEALSRMDAELSTILLRADAVITVSEAMHSYIREELKVQNVHVVHNGGERCLDDEDYAVGEALRQRVESLRNSCETLALWSGTHYPWHGFGMIGELIGRLPPKTGLVVASSDPQVLDRLPSHDRVVAFLRPSRDDVRWMLTQVDAGLALYGEFSWTRRGTFYGSSLKFWEYLANGLQVIASPLGHMATACDERALQPERWPSLHCVRTVSEAITALEGARRLLEAPPSARFWNDAARETAQIIESVLSSKKLKTGA